MNKKQMKKLKVPIKVYLKKINFKPRIFDDF